MEENNINDKFRILNNIITPAFSNFTPEDIKKLQELIGDDFAEIQDINPYDSEYKKLLLNSDMVSKIKNALKKIKKADAKKLNAKLVEEYKIDLSGETVQKLFQTQIQDSDLKEFIIDILSLEECPSGLIIDLNSNLISNEGVHHIVKYLSSPFNKIKEIDLSFNEIGDKGIVALSYTMFYNLDLHILLHKQSSGGMSPKITEFCDILLAKNTLIKKYPQNKEEIIWISFKKGLNVKPFFPSLKAICFDFISNTTSSCRFFSETKNKLPIDILRKVELFCSYDKNFEEANKTDEISQEFVEDLYLDEWCVENKESIGNEVVISQEPEEDLIYWPGEEIDQEMKEISNFMETIHSQHFYETINYIHAFLKINEVYFNQCFENFFIDPSESHNSFKHN